MAADAKVPVASGRSVYNKEFEGKTYICFDQEFTAKEKDKNNKPKILNSYNNFNDVEWETFVGILWEIDKLIPCFLMEPCAVCSDKKKQWEMFDNKLCISRLSPRALRDVIAANALATPPVMCDYCGADLVSNGGACHCHKFNCRQCSAENFCKGCGQNKYKPKSLA